MRTWIHPENYDAAKKLLEKLGIDPATVAGGASAAAIRELVAPLDRQALAAELGVGQLALDDMIEALCRPGRDPREDLPPPIFRKDVVKFEDLQAGMELRGTVLNVVDFGAFVDVGLSDSGLIHISQLSAGYVRDPHEVVAVGDQVRAWVASIDQGAPPRGAHDDRAGHRAAEARQIARPRSRPPTGRPAAARSRKLSRRKARRREPNDRLAPPRRRTRQAPTRRSSRPAATPAAHRLVTKNGLRNNWCRLRKKWKKAKPTSARSAICCSFKKKKEHEARRVAARRTIGAAEQFERNKLVRAESREIERPKCHSGP